MKNEMDDYLNEVIEYGGKEDGDPGQWRLQKKNRICYFEYSIVFDRMQVEKISG